MPIKLTDFTYSQIMFDLMLMILQTANICYHGNCLDITSNM